MQPKILFIEWIDSHSTPGWRDNQDINTHPMPCQSIGFLVKETEDAITVALSRTTDTDAVPYCDAMTIPKVAIVRKRVVKLKS